MTKSTIRELETRLGAIEDAVTLLADGVRMQTQRKREECGAKAAKLMPASRPLAPDPVDAEFEAWVSGQTYIPINADPDPLKTAYRAGRKGGWNAALKRTLRMFGTHGMIPQHSVCELIRDLMKPDDA